MQIMLNLRFLKCRAWGPKKKGVVNFVKILKVCVCVCVRARAYVCVCVSRGVGERCWWTGYFIPNLPKFSYTRVNIFLILRVHMRENIAQEIRPQRSKSFAKKIFPNSLHKKWSFLLRTSPVNVTKSVVSSRFGYVYWRNPSVLFRFFCLLF